MVPAADFSSASLAEFILRGTKGTLVQYIFIYHYALYISTVNYTRGKVKTKQDDLQILSFKFLK